MALDDLPLDRPDSPSHNPYDPEPEPKSPLRWVALVLACVVVAGLLAYWWMSRSQPTTPAAATPPPSSPVAEMAPTPEPIELPPLEESDTFIRDLVSLLSNHPALARLLASPSIVRSTTLGVIQIADGRTPTDWLRPLRPNTRIEITGDETGNITAESHARWNQVVAAIQSVSPEEAAQTYVNVKPLVDEAYAEVGQPDGSFDRTLVRAAQMLRATPDPATPPVVVRRQGYFEFEDPSFQALRPVQKQLLLLGPENRRQVLAWIDRFLRALSLE